MRASSARLAVAVAALALVLAQSGCGGGGEAKKSAVDAVYSTAQVVAAFRHFGMETVTSSKRDLRPAPFPAGGQSFVTADIRDPSGTSILRYEVVAAVFTSVEDARAAMPHGPRAEGKYLSRRFGNVIVAVTGFSFRPTSLPNDVAAVMRQLRTGTAYR